MKKKFNAFGAGWAGSAAMYSAAAGSCGFALFMIGLMLVNMYLASGDDA